MVASQELQHWGGRLCLAAAVALGMMGYHYANVRVLPLIAGFAILAGVCYVPRAVSPKASPLRPSGQHRAV